MEDISYLQKHTNPDGTYIFLVDSRTRELENHPAPAEYTVKFKTPFRNVYSVQLLDASIPRTEYSVDTINNKFSISNIDGTSKTTISVALGDWDTFQLSQQITLALAEGGWGHIVCEPLSGTEAGQPEITNKLIFKSQVLTSNVETVDHFELDMGPDSTMRTVLGCGPGVIKSHEGSNIDTMVEAICPSSCSFQYNRFRSIVQEKEVLDIDGSTKTMYYSALVTPGYVNLAGSTNYVLVRCKEIESYMYRERSNESYHAGIGMVRVTSRGYQGQRLEFISFPQRTFHPIDKLSQMTIRIERSDGTLYPTRGVDHSLLFVLRYYTNEHQIKGAPSPYSIQQQQQQHLHTYLQTRYKQEEEEEVPLYRKNMRNKTFL
jgi:hypothetical protein